MYLNQNPLAQEVTVRKQFLLVLLSIVMITLSFQSVLALTLPMQAEGPDLAITDILHTGTSCAFLKV